MAQESPGDGEKKKGSEEPPKKKSRKSGAAPADGESTGRAPAAGSLVSPNPAEDAGTSGGIGGASAAGGSLAPAGAEEPLVIEFTFPPGTNPLLATTLAGEALRASRAEIRGHTSTLLRETRRLKAECRGAGMPNLHESLVQQAMPRSSGASSTPSHHPVAAQSVPPTPQTVGAAPGILSLSPQIRTPAPAPDGTMAPDISADDVAAIFTAPAAEGSAAGAPPPGSEPAAIAEEADDHVMDFDIGQGDVPELPMGSAADPAPDLAPASNPAPEPTLDPAVVVVTGQEAPPALPPPPPVEHAGAPTPLQEQVHSSPPTLTACVLAGIADLLNSML